MAKRSVAEERRSSLARSARRAIARKGIAGATMRDVAVGTGLSTAIVSYYFNGKRDLVNSAVDLAAREFQRRVARHSVKAATPWEQLEAHVRAVFDGPTRERREELAFWAECWSEAARSDDMRKLHNQRFRAWLGELRAIIVLGQETGEFRDDDDASALAAFVASAIDGVWLHSVIDAGTVPARGLADVTVSLLGRAILAEGA